MENPILLAYGFDGTGAGIALEGDAITRRLKNKELTWVHLDANVPESRSWVQKEIGHLDPFITEALLEDETRPRMAQVDGGVLLILRGVNLNENAAPEDMVTIRMWVDEHRIISLRRRKLKAVGDLEEKIKEGKGPRDAGEFISMLAWRLFARMEPVFGELDDATAAVEESVLDDADTSLSDTITDIRKQAIVFRRYMAPQRDAIGQLRMTEMKWLDDEHRRHLQESYNHVTRYVEDLDAIRERSQILKDELASFLADRINKNMYVLSIVAAIFLPLSFLTGLLGINLAGIPGAENANAFWIFSGLLSIVVVVQIFAFKRFKLF